MKNQLQEIFKRSFRCILYGFLLGPFPAYAENIDTVDPWNRALYTVLQIMTGPTASTIGAIALAGSGYLFLRGRIDVMRLLAIIAGLGLIYGAPHLVSLLQQQTDL